MYFRLKESIFVRAGHSSTLFVRTLKLDCRQQEQMSFQLYICLSALAALLHACLRRLLSMALSSVC